LPVPGLPIMMNCCGDLVLVSNLSRRNSRRSSSTHSISFRTYNWEPMNPTMALTAATSFTLPQSSSVHSKFFLKAPCAGKSPRFVHSFSIRRRLSSLRSCNSCCINWFTSSSAKSTKTWICAVSESAWLSARSKAFLIAFVDSIGFTPFPLMSTRKENTGISLVSIQAPLGVFATKSLSPPLREGLPTCFAHTLLISSSKSLTERFSFISTRNNGPRRR